MKFDILKKTQILTKLLRLTIRDAAPGSYQVWPESLQTFQSSKVKNENESMPSEIGFPTLTGDVFLNQKPNKQTSHE